MPNLNQKGPMGEGLMIGRKMGRCANYGARRSNQILQENENRETPINDNSQVQGQALERGRGMGRCMKNGMRNGIGQIRGSRGMKRNGGGGGRGMGMGRRFRDDIQE